MQAIKSLVLKFVEHMHALEQMDPADMEYGHSARLNKEVGSGCKPLAAARGSGTGYGVGWGGSDKWVALGPVSVWEQVGRLRDAMQAKSDMSDVLVRVLKLWKSGVLIMDEVDQLLHPLRSELNFPIGHKDPIDLAGYRWDLPIFLIDGVFSTATATRLSERIDAGAAARAGLDSEAVLKVRGQGTGFVPCPNSTCWRALS